MSDLSNTNVPAGHGNLHTEGMPEDAPPSVGFHPGGMTHHSPTLHFHREVMTDHSRALQFYPEGMTDNSPTLQRWVTRRDVISPEGTAELTDTGPRADFTRGLSLGQTSPCARRAFTLIELLIVIAIIAILAALIFPVTGAMNRKKMVSRAKAELNLVKMAIDNYQTKLGFYPPDNTNSFVLNQLYFELMGTTNNGSELITLDGSALAHIPTAGPELRQIFGPGVQGFANSNARNFSEEARTAQRFLRSDLKPAQVASVANPNYPNVKLLVCSIPGPYPIKTPQVSALAPINANPFRYNSSNPTNNANSYDLWVDIVISGKTNRISNWSSDPTIVATP